MTMTLCTRHQDALTMELELRGFLRVSLVPDPAAFDALGHATTLIVEHATNFAGRASIQMLTQHVCPICFINGRQLKVRGEAKPLNVDGWVCDAAEDALAESIRHQDTPAKLRPVVLTS